MSRSTDTTGAGAEMREREEQLKFLKSLGHKLRKVSGETTYWVYTNATKKISYEQLKELYDREKMTAQDGYTRLILNRKGDA